MLPTRRREFVYNLNILGHPTLFRFPALESLRSGPPELRSKQLRLKTPSHLRGAARRESGQPRSQRESLGRERAKSKTAKERAAD